jgi:hypothetical protein
MTAIVELARVATGFDNQSFGRFWRGLELPRHIHLFSLETLSMAASKAGFTVRRLRTTVENAQIFAHGSLAVRNGQVPSTPANLLFTELRAKSAFSTQRFSCVSFRGNTMPPYSVILGL